MKFHTDNGKLDVTIDQIFVAGWTGRDKSAVEHHIQELAAIGIAPPSRVPLYYQVSNYLLTHKSSIDVLGDGSSGEVEPLLIQANEQIWIGLASDHTDRDLEAHSVAASKQICAKPAAQELWKFNDVKEHLDMLILRCLIKENNEWITYQEGSLSSIRPLNELIDASGFTENSAMLCGTLAAIGGVRSASIYKMQLEDPVLNRTISMEYSVNALQIIN